MVGFPRIITAWTVAALLLGGASLSFGQAGPQDNWVLEPDLKWGAAGTGNGQFAGPRGIAVNTQFVYVTDTENHRIQVFTKDGAYTNKWGSGGSGNGQMNSPYGIAVDGTNIYVAEKGNERIQVFDLQGNYLRKWGSAGTGDGQFNDPIGVAVDTQHVFVVDNLNYRVQVFDKAGNFVRKWGSNGTVAGQFLHPMDVAVDHLHVYVVDAYLGTIQAFQKDGTFVRSWSLPLGQVPDSGLWRWGFGLDVDAHGLYSAISFGNQYGLVRHAYQVHSKYDNQLFWQWTNVASASNPLAYMSDLAADSPYVYIVDWSKNVVQAFRRIFRTLGPLTNDAPPLADILSVQQRNGQPILDVDYVLADPDDSTVTVYAVAFAVSTNAAPHLADLVPMRTFVEGTATNLGPGIAPGPVRRLSWDMEADQLDNVITNYGNVKVSLLAKDDRGLLDLHFISIPAVGTNTAFEISRDPLYHHDFLPVWFWYLAAGDTNIALTGGQVVGVGGAYNGLTLASGTNTTADGRSFLYGRLNVRDANANELQVAREGSTPGSVALWTPRREPPPAGYKVNAFNFVTSPTNGWWVVPLP